MSSHPRLDRVNLQSDGDAMVVAVLRVFFGIVSSFTALHEGVRGLFWEKGDIYIL